MLGPEVDVHAGAEAPRAQPSPSSGAPKTAGTGAAGRWQRLSASRVGKGIRFTYTWRRPLLFGLASGWAATQYYLAVRRAAKRDAIKDDTLLVWRMYDGHIVEYPSSQRPLYSVLSSEQDSIEPPRVMTLFDAVKALRYVQADPRITGIFADFSRTNAPSLPDGAPLGLAQIEELSEAIADLKAARGKDFRTVAFSESFESQSEYLMASNFDEIYIQPTGGVPLVGLSSVIPFWARLIRWAGINVQAEARKEYKSVVSAYTQEQLTEPQAANQEELLNDLNDNMLGLIASNRFASEIDDDDPASYKRALQKVKDISLQGPLSAKEAVEKGLVTGTAYKRELLEHLLGLPPAWEAAEHAPQALKMAKVKPFVAVPPPAAAAETAVIKPPNAQGSAEGEGEAEGSEDERMSHEERTEKLEDAFKNRTRGFYHYWKVRTKQLQKTADIMDVGVVYVLGTIGDVGEFGTGSIVRGLREAADDPSIGAVVLRIDTGGGGVIESDTIWGAVRDLRNKGKIVVASFGNVAASGGYLIATHADAIFAAPSTITGSIGVAGLRPSFTSAFFDKLKINVQSFFTGSKYFSPVHPLEGADQERNAAHVDEMYEDFKDRVCTGRGVSKDLVDSLAGGRVYTGLKAWELLYPPEEEEDKAKEVKEAVQEATARAAESLEAAEAGGGEAVEGAEGDAGKVVAISEGQETSPYAPPEPPALGAEETTALASEPSLSGPSAPAQAAEALGRVSDDRDQEGAGGSPVPEAEGSSGGPLLDTDGPLGRGIVDGLGGIQVAAVYAVEAYLAMAFEQQSALHPEKSKADIMAEILPGARFTVSEDEEKMVLPLDVRLKKFPLHRPFWQSLVDAWRAGDATDGGASALVRAAFAGWLARAAAHLVDAEASGLGLSELRRELRRAGAARGMGSSRMRMEAPGFRVA